ncbi:expressed unknown protein [Seminavis robusta]|uniref:YCII-related domain-containing protein n=1 Tax=Seminavis robusta TaxID=568900 RepID=A0A9N8EKI8_9STRA|nr:expressed unknown protein [Seminavis robusta]|eukprot:Sro1078_g238810.1 n/a (172) ;mRNA; r:27606-28121
MASPFLNPHPRQLYVVHCFDGPSATERLSSVADPAPNSPNHRRMCGVHRVECYEEHVAYQLSTSKPKHDCFIQKVAAAPKLAKDGLTIVGSSFLLRGTQEECSRFIQNDPYYKKSVWASVSIQRYLDSSSTGRAFPPTKLLHPVPVKRTYGIQPIQGDQINGALQLHAGTA